MNQGNHREFYVGWQDEMPKATGKFLTRFVAVLSVLLLVLVIMVVIQQKPYNDHQFEFGQTKLITGTYHHMPVPMLVADDGMLPDFASGAILLVGYGKWGAEGIMAHIEAEQGELNGRRITLRGTLIHGDGKTLMELTGKEDPFVEILGDSTLEVAPTQSSKLISLV
ncbi:MAG: hypothetical protein OEQ53_16070, partial [Saprospiraceae bacterium]|nr:hypothetical protein [Saprospiraceae bacterium]